MSVSEVSRERKCLQISAEQLMATKDKKDNKSELQSREAREFVGRWRKNPNTVKTVIPHLGKFAFGTTKIPGKNWRNIQFFGVYILRDVGRLNDGIRRGRSNYEWPGQARRIAIVVGFASFSTMFISTPVVVDSSQLPASGFRLRRSGERVLVLCFCTTLAERCGASFGV